MTFYAAANKNNVKRAIALDKFINTSHLQNVCHEYKQGIFFGL